MNRCLHAMAPPVQPRAQRQPITPAAGVAGRRRQKQERSDTGVRSGGCAFANGGKDCEARERVQRPVLRSSRPKPAMRMLRTRQAPSAVDQAASAAQGAWAARMRWLKPSAQAA